MPRKKGGLPYEVHPTPAKGKDGKNIMYVKPVRVSGKCGRQYYRGQSDWRRWRQCHQPVEACRTVHVHHQYAHLGRCRYAGGYRHHAASLALCR